MNYEILAVANPIRVSPQAIDLTLTLKTPGGTVNVPFTATSYDLQDYGRELYTAASGGAYGAIADGESA